MLVEAEVLREEEGFQFGFKKMGGLSSVEVLVGMNSKCGVQSNNMTCWRGELMHSTDCL